MITLPAVLNHSEVWETPRYRSSTFVSIVITIANTAPRPTTMNQPQLSSSTSPIANPSAMAPAPNAGFGTQDIASTATSATAADGKNACRDMIAFC